ncbi:MAG: WYL domain-containing protein [Rhodoferax sp.]|nr:WYL domain-containing protein [Rhodoferax sp.]
MGTVSQRSVRPLGCFYWGKVWTLAAWCEMRHGFRSFRLDRMDAVAPPHVQAKWSKEG